MDRNIVESCVGLLLLPSCIAVTHHAGACATTQHSWRLPVSEPRSTARTITPPLCDDNNHGHMTGRCPGKLAEGAGCKCLGDSSPPTKRAPNVTAVCPVWRPCVRHPTVDAPSSRSPSGRRLGRGRVVSGLRKHMRTLFQQLAAMPGRH